jgi:hypothetical protein
VRCAAGSCIKSVKKCISRARTPRGHDAWEPLVDIKSEVSTLPKVESRPEFSQDHESGLRSDRGPVHVVLCDYSQL